jgi:hypothetical protein
VYSTLLPRGSQVVSIRLIPRLALGFQRLCRQLTACSSPGARKQDLADPVPEIDPQAISDPSHAREWAESDPRHDPTTCVNMMGAEARMAQALEAIQTFTRQMTTHQVDK